jgi:hypothetical protein
LSGGLRGGLRGGSGGGGCCVCVTLCVCVVHVLTGVCVLRRASVWRAAAGLLRWQPALALFVLCVL